MLKIFYLCLLGCFMMNCSLVAMEEKERHPNKPFFSQQNSTTYSSDESTKQNEKPFDEKIIEKLETIFEKSSLGIKYDLEKFLQKNPGYEEPLQTMARDYFYEKMNNTKIHDIFLAGVFPFCGWVKGNTTIGIGECDYLVTTLQKHIPQNQRVGYMEYLQNLLVERAQENLSLGRIVNRARREFLQEQK